MMELLTIIVIVCAILSVVMVAAAYLFIPANEEPGWTDGADIDNWSEEQIAENKWVSGETCKEESGPGGPKAPPPRLMLLFEDFCDYLDQLTDYRNANVGRDHRRN